MIGKTANGADRLVEFGLDFRQRNQRRLYAPLCRQRVRLSALFKQAGAHSLPYWVGIGFQAPGVGQWPASADNRQLVNAGFRFDLDEVRFRYPAPTQLGPVDMHHLKMLAAIRTLMPSNATIEASWDWVAGLLLFQVLDFYAVRSWYLGGRQPETSAVLQLEYRLRFDAGECRRRLARWPAERCCQFDVSSPLT